MFFLLRLGYTKQELVLRRENYTHLNLGVARLHSRFATNRRSRSIQSATAIDCIAPGDNGQCSVGQERLGIRGFRQPESMLHRGRLEK
jgi:hypothetical protein